MYDSSGTVFVTGGTGYVGRRLIPLLLARGHRVRALVRPGSERKLTGRCEPVIGDPLDAFSYVSRIVPARVFVHLVGVPHPSPSKAAEFIAVDQKSLEQAVPAAKTAGVRHFVYVSVAHPAPAMKAYIEVRERCEQIVRSSGMKATILRPWYVLGPGHRWPHLLQPLYWLAERIPDTREGALRLGLVTLPQMITALTEAVENEPKGIRIVTVPEIRAAQLREPLRQARTA